MAWGNSGRQSIHIFMTCGEALEYLATRPEFEKEFHRLAGRRPIQIHLVGWQDALAVEAFVVPAPIQLLGLDGLPVQGSDTLGDLLQKGIQSHILPGLHRHLPIGKEVLQQPGQGPARGAAPHLEVFGRKPFRGEDPEDRLWTPWRCPGRAWASVGEQEKQSIPNNKGMDRVVRVIDSGPLWLLSPFSGRRFPAVRAGCP